MGYGQTLEVLARLHLDGGFRAAFLTEPDRALLPLALSDEERRALAQLDPRSVIRMGRFANFHRLMRIQEHIPWVDLSLRPNLRPLVEEFMVQVQPGLLNRDEAVLFCRHLEAATCADPPYLCELGRYERLRISLSWETFPDDARRIHVENFQYPVLTLLGSLGQAGWPQADPGRHSVQFKKVFGIPAVVVREVAVSRE